MILLSALIALLVAIWVLTDTRKREVSWIASILWFFGVWGLMLLFLPLWLIFRPKLKDIPTLSLDLSRPEIDHILKGVGVNIQYCPYCGHKLEAPS